MRQAWGTIRERLGLRPSAPPPADPAMGNPDQGNPGGDTNSPSVLNGESLASATPDTRELMLAEMARAFNIGLGLNGLGGMPPAASDTTGPVEHDTAEGSTAAASAVNADAEGDPLPHSQSPPSSPSGSVAMPPEGSFERFLVDLQVDLRAALTHAEDEPQPERMRQPPQQPDSQVVQSSGSPTFNAEHSSPDAPAASSSTNSTSPQSRQSEIATSDPQPSSDDSSYTDMPALHYVSDSDSELDEEEHDDGEYDDEDGMFLLCKANDTQKFVQISTPRNTARLILQASLCMGRPGQPYRGLAALTLQGESTGGDCIGFPPLSRQGLMQPRAHLVLRLHL